MRHFRRHAQAFAQRGVWVYGLADVDGVGAHFDGQCDLADHVAGVRADNAAAQENEDITRRIGRADHRTRHEHTDDEPVETEDDPERALPEETRQHAAHEEQDGGGNMQRRRQHRGIIVEAARPVPLFQTMPDPSSRPPSARRLGSAREAAKQSGAIMLLKGDDTIVTDGERVAVNRIESPALATAGTGDVLSGMIAALIARGMEPFAGTCAAVVAHGRAGRAAAEVVGAESVIVTDVIDSIPSGLAP